MQQSIEQLLKIKNGFKPFEEEAEKLVHSHTIIEAKSIAIDLLKNEAYQIRCCAVFILGLIAAKDKSALIHLKSSAVLDDSWQVQEIIAKAFDQFCADNGYERSLQEITEWLNDKSPTVCRAVTEGLRIWTSRPYFKDHPQEAISLISKHKANESTYLRKSVGNALRDIAKKHSALIEREIAQWNLEDTKIRLTFEYVKKRH